MRLLPLLLLALLCPELRLCTLPLVLVLFPFPLTPPLALLLAGLRVNEQWSGPPAEAPAPQTCDRGTSRYSDPSLHCQPEEEEEEGSILMHRSPAPSVTSTAAGLSKSLPSKSLLSCSAAAASAASVSGRQ